jgi:hypothetical protein
MNTEKFDAAMAYLKARGIYLLDNKFKPTNAASTDVAKTIARYRAQTTNTKPIRVAK